MVSWLTYRKALKREDGVRNLDIVLDQDRLPGGLGITKVGVLMGHESEESVDQSYGLLVRDASAASVGKCRGGQGESRSDDGELHLELCIDLNEWMDQRVGPKVVLYRTFDV